MRLLGLLHGVLVTMVLILRPRPSAPRRMLALLMVVLTAYLGMHELDAAHGANVPKLVTGLKHGLPFLFGPLLYLYVAAETGRWLRLRLSSALHLAPFLLTIGSAFGLHVSTDGMILLNLAHASHGLGYAAGATRVLRSYTARVADLGVQAEVRDRLLWLWSLVGVHGATTVLPVCSWVFTRLSFAAELRVTLVVYWIAAALIVFPRAFRNTAHVPRISTRWHKRLR